mmetsp:Transcript_14142/g.39099  ORF Transcript_14142/g.39099 Transcript_14142/m.39099 type:complete len:154 (+) Transcript_14142:601-1062(+)
MLAIAERSSEAGYEGVRLSFGNFVLRAELGCTTSLPNPTSNCLGSNQAPLYWLVQIVLGYSTVRKLGIPLLDHMKGHNTEYHQGKLNCQLSEGSTGPLSPQEQRNKSSSNTAWSKVQGYILIHLLLLSIRGHQHHKQRLLRPYSTSGRSFFDE